MTKKRIGAALSLVFIAAVVSVFALHLNPFAVVLHVALAVGILGSTVTYADPSTSAPTQAQASAAQSVTATVNFSDADTTATITHNWSLTTAQLAKLRPWVNVLVMGGMSVYPGLTWALATNTIVVTKASTATNSGGTINVVIQRPWSPMSTIDAR